MFDFSIFSQVRRGGFSIAGGRPSRLNGSVKGVRIKNIPPLSQLKPKITLGGSCTELGGRLQKERHLQKQMPFFFAGYEDSKPLGCLQFT